MPEKSWKQSVPGMLWISTTLMHIFRGSKLKCSSTCDGEAKYYLYPNITYLILPLLKAVSSFFLKFISHFDKTRHKELSGLVRIRAFFATSLCIEIFGDFFSLTWDLCLPLLYWSNFSSLCSLTGRPSLNNQIQTIPSSELPPFTNINKHNYHSDELHKVKHKTPPRMLSILCCAKKLCFIVPHSSTSIFSTSTFTRQGWDIWRVPWVK